MEITHNSDWLHLVSVKYPHRYFIKSESVNLNFHRANQLVDLIQGDLESDYPDSKKFWFLLEANHSPQFILTLLALWRCGYKVIPVSPETTDNELRNLSNLLKFTRYVKPYNLNYPDIHLAGKEYSLNWDNDSLALLTSGSSGIPKIVRHTLSTLFESVNNYRVLIPHDNHNILASLPFFHTGGFMVIVRAILTASTFVIPESVKPEQIHKALQKHKPGVISLVEPQLRWLYLHSETNDHIPSTTLLGGGPAKPELITAAINKGWKLVNVYGSTETASFITFNSEVQKYPDSAGKPVNGVSVTIEDDEIVVKSPSISVGYLSGENNEEVFRDGKYYSGDLGYFSDNGHLYITGRKGRKIISGGKNIDPVEIENELLKLENVEDVFVTSVNDLLWGEKVVALIAMKSIEFIDDYELKENLKKSLPGYKIPKTFHFVDDIPRNYFGKINMQEINSLLKSIG